MITGYPILDGLTGGFAKGNLITIVGGTLTGRTMFTMNILRNQLNVDAPSRIAFMTAEMDADDAEQKLLELAGNEKDIERIKSLFAFCDVVKCCRDFEDFQIKICQLVKEKNLDAVVIDSFHFLPFYDDLSPRKMSSVSRRLKLMMGNSIGYFYKVMNSSELPFMFSASFGCPYVNLLYHSSLCYCEFQQKATPKSN